jgi:hypothetical protein
MFWENLRTLYYLVKYKNIKTVSFFLKIHPSTITRRITQLENNFNNKLFEDYKSFTLSTFGEKIITYLYDSCDNFEKLTDKNINVEDLHVNNQFVIYLTDVYYYNVLLHLYNNNLLCKYFFNIRYISIITYDTLNNLINTNVSNFLYITGDNNIEASQEYMCIPIYEIPIYLYKNNHIKTNHIIKYSGEEIWLKNLYKNYNIHNKNVICSNSIHILSKMIYCVSEGILPHMYSKSYNILSKTKIDSYKLMLIFHKNNMALQKFFAFNTIKNN